ncbi:hypothetical protein F4804DRAFT_314561 [Jackrogersella minutella]|nr:hypothetical protein F4804DRAFT_314561 [Jackrogersella minutella]
MKFSTLISFLTATGLAAAMPSSHQTRSVSDVLPNLKRDMSGAGFTHVGSDNVVRTFDKNFNVVDYAQLDDRAPSADGWPRSPSAAVLDDAKQAKARSTAQVSKPRSRSPLEGRQQPSCVSEFCPEDSYCQGLSIYGYNCTSCMIVSNNIGNCQQF